MILRWHSVGHLIEYSRLSGRNKQFTFVTTCSNPLCQDYKPFCITPKKSRLDIHDNAVHSNGKQTTSYTPWQQHFSPTIISPISTFRRENIQMKEDWEIWPWRQLNPSPCIFNLDIRWRWRSRTVNLLEKDPCLLWIGRWLESKPAWNIDHIGSWNLEVKSIANSLYGG
jgi:hypothetical protein